MKSLFARISFVNKFYITTAIPYVNAPPHIGHALEFAQADAIARYHNILGDQTLLLSGADENALKNVQAAEKEKITVQELVDKNSKLFEDLAKKLNVDFDVFQRGSDSKHHASSQKLWQLCDASLDIYNKRYKGLYCIGCELFYTKEELDEKGECLEHPGKKLEEVEEENYFFRLSKYQNKLIKLLESNTLEIVPEFRKKEMLSFLKNPLQDISISRSNERAKNWGVKIPGDETQRMYVWFDALNIYISGAEKWWPADLHVIGKGILRFHAIYWPAFLLSAKLKLPKKIFVHEYVTVNGQKMSKTVGNVLDPIPLIEKYGADALRYYLLAKISPFSDGDFSEEKFKEVYNADLANGLGNLVARVAKLAEKHGVKAGSPPKNFNGNVKKFLSNFEFNWALNAIWGIITLTDVAVSNDKVWELPVGSKHAEEPLSFYIKNIQEIALNLKPFLPETSRKIEEQFKGPKITSQKPLFPRI